jgi:histidyl-tRNA synthetase
MKNVSTEPYKGARDFYPEEMRIRNYIFGAIRKVVESHGFEEYDASIMEESSLYRAKTGEEIVNEQTYNFIDRGGREVTLRPEMTPTVSRMIARKRNQLLFPLRWFNIGRRYRYERMQRGRSREFWQLDCDMFGVESVVSDVELLLVPRDILKELRVDDKLFEIRINHRGLVNEILKNYIHADDQQTYKLSKLIDRKNKIEKSLFDKEVENILGDKKELFLGILEINNLSDLPDQIKQTGAYDNLKQICDSLEKLGVTNYRFDPTLMRGFDYYTGMIFEIFALDNKNNRSLFGGGRYDNLVAIFGVDKVPGIGFGMGDVTIRDFLETHNLLPNNAVSNIDLYLCILDEKYRLDVELLARDLRANKINVCVDISGKKLGAQIKHADKMGVGYVIVIGENEINNKKYLLKNMLTSEQQEFDFEGLGKVILN